MYVLGKFYGLGDSEYTATLEVPVVWVGSCAVAAEHSARVATVRNSDTALATCAERLKPEDLQRPKTGLACLIKEGHNRSASWVARSPPASSL